MKTYNFKKAKTLIENTPNIRSASIGMYEDWGWTAETVYNDGEFTTELSSDTEIRGINGSVWATPTLQICLKDGTVKMIEISAG